VLLYQVIDLHLPYRAVYHVVGQVSLRLLLVQLPSTTCGSIMQELLAAAHHIIEAINLLRPLLVLLL
jgi:hypothetical protein